MQLASDSLLAFQRDLEARGLADRVLVRVWTEFGRRAEENGDAGTDHGAARTGFLIGSRVTGTMVGGFPGLKTGLDDDGNLIETADYRGVYAALLEQWFGVDASAVIPNAGSFAAGPYRVIAQPHHAPPPPPARVQVVAKEFSYSLSRRKVKAGKVIIELINPGQDTHDLDIERVGSKHIFHFPKVETRPLHRQDADAQAREAPPVVRGRRPQGARHAGDAARRPPLTK